MKKLLLFLLLVATTFGQGTDNVKYDRSTGNVYPLTTNGKVLNLPVNTTVGGIAIGSGGGGGGDAFQAQDLGQFATTTPARLALVLSGETGTGAPVFGTSPTLVTPILGTPQSVVLTNGTGLPISTGVSGLGTGAAAFLAAPTGATFDTMLTGAVPFTAGGTGLTTLGSALQVIRVNAAGTALEYGTVSGGGGGITGPGSTSDNALVRWDGTGGAAVQNSGITVADGASGTLSGTNTGDQTTITGNAGTATTLATARTLSITGDLAWTSPVFDGSANVTAPGTLATTGVSAGTYGSSTVAPTFTVDAKGRLTVAGGVVITPAITNVTGLGTGVGQFLTTPTSAFLATAVTNETGTGALVFGTSPALVTPALGTPASGIMTNVTGIALGLTAGVTNSLKSTTTSVDVAASTAPSAGQTLVATDSTHATWQNGGNVAATSVFGSDNKLVRTDGTSRNIQSTGITVDDVDSITGVNELTATDTDTQTFTVLDNVDHTFGLGFIVASNLAANKTFTYTGPYNYEMILSGDTSVTFPTSGTLATIADVIAGSGGTVTHTGGALTSNAVVLGAGAADVKVSTGITTNGASTMTLGVAGATAGNLVFSNATSGTLTLKPTTGALGASAITFPAVNGGKMPSAPEFLSFVGMTGARTITLPDANFTVARTDAANTFTGVQTMTSPSFSGTATGTADFLPVTLFNSGTNASATTYWRGDGTWTTPPGTGTVTSAAMTGDGVVFNASVTGSPITTTGTFAPTLVSQAANTFFANGTGSSATPTFISAGTARTAMGGTSVGQNIFTMTNPGVITFLKILADNTVGTRTAPQFRTDLSLVPGTDVQAFDPDLSALAALSGTNDIYYRSGASTWTSVTIGSGLDFSGGTLSVSGLGSGTVTATGGALTANAVVLGAGTTDSKVSTGITTDGASALNLGVVGATAGNLVFANATSGTLTLKPTTGALGSSNLTFPAVNGGKVPSCPQFLSFVGPTAARTITLPDAAFTVARTDAANTFTGVQTMTSPVFTTPVLGTPSSGTLTNCTFPTLNQNTTGSAASLSISGQTGLVTLTGLASTDRVKTVRDAADTILELGGSYTPTGTWTNMTLVTPALGTPSALVLTNATGTPSAINLTNGTALPVAGITASTSTALGVGSLEVGAASDTTIARVSAGKISVEGVNVVTTSSTDTLTNKTLTSPVLTTPDLGTPSALVVTNATGTASININGTVGATTPTTGAFTTITNTGLQTNSASGTASNPAMKLTGVPMTIGTGTTNFPLFYINDANATASTTLSTNGTYFGVNGDGSEDLMNLLKDGTSQFSVSSAGVVTGAGAMSIGTANAFTAGTVELGAASDTTLARVSAGKISVEGVNVVTTSSTDTLTNKTLTSPVLTTPDIGTPSAGVVTNLTGTASININGTVGATTPAAGTFTTGVFGSTTSLLLGTAGSAVGNVGFRNATSGTITVAPPTGALGTVTLTLPAATDTLVGKATTDTLTNKTLTSPTFTTPVLGTPSSGTLTNTTGLPATGLVADTTTAVGFGSIELGHATDTTIARVSAGKISVEGVNVVTTSSTDTLTNKTLTSPTLTTPALGTPTSGVLNACTGGGGYVMDGGISSWNPVDATTYYMGYGENGAAGTHTTYGNASMVVPKAGTITRITWKTLETVAGTTEQVAHYLRLNDTTDTTLSTTETYDASSSSKTFTYTGLSIAVAAGDTIAFKIVCPTWSTNPTHASAHLMVWIE